MVIVTGDRGGRAVALVELDELALFWDIWHARNPIPQWHTVLKGQQAM